MANEQLKNRTQQTIDAIPVLREKEYGWDEIEKMLNEILIELDDTPWHTGTPTEEGWYLLHVRGTIPFRVAYMRNWQWLSTDDSRIRTDVVIEWQKIEENENG